MIRKNFQANGHAGRSNKTTRIRNFRTLSTFINIALLQRVLSHQGQFESGFQRVNCFFFLFLLALNLQTVIPRA